MKKIIITIILVLDINICFALKYKASFYKNHISYLYLYQQNIELYYVIYKSEIWSRVSLINKLNTSLSLITSIKKDLKYMVVGNKEKNIHKFIIKITDQTINLTKTFIRGLESNSENWEKLFVKAKSSNYRQILQLTEMEE